MPDEGRIIGLDVGDVRIGVAVSDPLGSMALPRDTIERKSLQDDLARLRDIVAEVKAVRIVAGLPLTLEGAQGPQAEKVLAFVEEVRRELAIEVVMQDERFSTKSVERALIQADVSRKKRKSVVDKLAAQQILQTYLDRQAFARRREEQ